MQLGEEPKSKKLHVDVKLASTKYLLKRLRNHGRRLRKMKEDMTVLREKIFSRCHGGDDEGGHDVEGEGVMRLRLRLNFVSMMMKSIMKLQLLLKQ